ncbi:transmembrane protein 225 [Ochotona princeps]|uniref:transmembrane protein 225 n=1 Tax=Ochotona princeps TaxID=9978 RepID=UPI00271548F4|nr:transmembrane protein 225 [Ochotona princeps]
MIHISRRNIQAISTLAASWATILLAIGIIMDDWAELTPDQQQTKVNHSPWMECCTATWPEDDLAKIRMIMVAVLSISFSLNLILALEYTYMIPHNMCLHLFTATAGFASGILLVSALLLYHQKLTQGESVYFIKFKVSLAIFIAYVNAFFFFVTGFFSILQCRQFTHCCSCLCIIDSDKDRETTHTPKPSVQMTSLRERTVTPRSIVRAHSSISSKDVIPSRSQVQSRRVTWAL